MIGKYKGLVDRAVTNLTFQRATKMALIASIAILGACGLPRSGPTKSEIFAGSVQEEGDAFVI